MGASVHSLQVVLEKDIDVESVEPLMRAIECMRGVLTVAHCPSDLTTFMAENRANTTARTKLLTILKEWR